VDQLDDAKLHVLSHVVSYGSAVFGRYPPATNKQGPAIFRLREHMQRLNQLPRKFTSMELPFSVEQFANTACELVRLNKLNPATGSPSCSAATGAGVNPLNSPIDVYMLAGGWGAYPAPELFRKALKSASAHGPA